MQEGALARLKNRHKVNTFNPNPGDPSALAFAAVLLGYCH